MIYSSLLIVGCVPISEPLRPRCLLPINIEVEMQLSQNTARRNTPCVEQLEIKLARLLKQVEWRRTISALHRIDDEYLGKIGIGRHEIIHWSTKQNKMHD